MLEIVRFNERSIRRPRNLSRKREWDWEVLKTRNCAWREWYVGSMWRRKVLRRESKSCSASREGSESVGNNGSRYVNRVVMSASRVVIVSRRVVSEVLMSRIPEEVSVASSILGGSVFISSSEEYCVPSN